MIKIPENIQKIQNYKPGKTGAATVQKSIALCSNENNLGPSKKAIHAMSRALKEVHRYPDPIGMLLKEQLAKKLMVQEDQIILGMGSDNILYTMFKAFFEPGDELVTSEGSFAAIDPMAQMNNIRIKKVPLNKTYGFDLEAISKQIDENTKVVYICNPNNPTGSYIPKSELEEFVNKISEDILIVIDEAYFEYAQFLHNDYPDSTKLNQSNVLTLRTFSKIYGLAGERIGYGIGDPELIGALWKVKPTFVPGILAQVGALAALEDEEHLNLSITLNAEILSDYYHLFDKLGIQYVPTATNFLTLVFKNSNEAKMFHDYLAENGILVRHLVGFGLPELVRVSTGTKEEWAVLEKVLDNYTQL